jgi:tetratricopeptide (TPR) repeat protein
LSYLAVAVLAAIAATVLFGPDLYRSWKHDRLVRQARDFIKAEDVGNAAICLRKALLSNPSSRDASRLMADLAEKARSREAINWRSRLVDLEPTNAQFRVEWADTALLLGDSSTAERALTSLDESGRRLAGFHKSSGALALTRKEYAAAETHFAEVLRLDPTNATARLNLAAVRLQSTNGSIHAEASREIKRLASIPGVRADALRYLATDALERGANDDALRCSDELTAEPGATFLDRIFGLSVLRQSKSPRLTGQIAELQREANADPNHVFALAQWMLNAGRASDAAAWLKALPPDLQGKLPVPLIAFDCYASLRDWTSLGVMLDSQDWGHLDFYRLALRAGVHREKKETAVARTTWLSALKAADGHLDRMSHLARSTGSWGWTEETEEVMKMIVQQFPSEKWAMQSLSSWFHTSGKTVALRNLLVRAAEADPANLQVKGVLALTSLLLDPQDAKMHDLARDVYQQRPDDPFFTSAYAYSLCLQRKFPEALEFFRKLKPEQLQEPTIAAYYGIVLCEAGKRTEAQQYLELAGRARLLPEEKELLKRAKARS